MHAHPLILSLYHDHARCHNGINCHIISNGSMKASNYRNLCCSFHMSCKFLHQVIEQEGLGKLQYLT